MKKICINDFEEVCFIICVATTDVVAANQATVAQKEVVT